MKELPQIAKRIGKISISRKIYIEDYVLDFLERFKTEKKDQAVRVILYGKSWMDSAEDICVVYGAEERNGEEEAAKGIFEEYEEVGCLNMEIWSKTSGMCDGILIGGENGGQPIEGYYIFYENHPVMEKYLGLYYMEELKKGMHRGERSGKMQESSGGKEKMAELVALSTEAEPAAPLYDFIRMAVILIFIVFCAIAVTAVNSYDKLESFTNTAVQMGEKLEDDSGGMTGNVLK